MRFILSMLLLAQFGFVIGQSEEPADTLSTDSLITSEWQMPVPDTLIIGVKHTPPFIVVGADGAVSGLSVVLWERISGEHLYKYRIYQDLPGLLQGMENDEIDLSINPVTVSAERLQTFDFSQPFFIADTSFVRESENSFFAFVKNLFSWQFFTSILVLFAVIFIFGFLAWIFERRKNKEFQGKYRGIGESFWWSAVTMTTVGYGDKSPVTTGGRTIAMVWMFTAVILISTITASIASTLTVQSLGSDITSVRDLREYRVGTVRGTNSSTYLEVYNVHYEEFDTVEGGLNAVENGEIDVFVYEKPILQYYLEQGGYDLEISENGIKRDYYSFLYPKGSELQKEIDADLVKQLNSPEWQLELEGY